MPAHGIVTTWATAAGALVLGSLCSCGSDPDRGAGAASSATPISTPSPGDGGSPKQSTSVERVDLSGSALAGFTAQGGAIACLFDRSGDAPAVRCDVLENSWAAPPKPRGCRLDWGQSVGLAADGSPGRFLCVGDTVIGIPAATDGSNELASGTVATFGVLACLVQPNGVSCYDTSRGEHSIFVTPLTYEVI